MPISSTDDGNFDDGAEFDVYLKALDDLAQNIAGMDDRLLVSADLNILRATLREFRTQARKAIQEE